MADEPLAIAFANTVRRRGGEYEELLLRGADLRLWAAGQAPSPSPAAAKARLNEVRAVRDAVFATLLAATRGAVPPRTAERRLNEVLAAVPLVPQLRRGKVELTASGADPIDELLARAAASALALLDDPALGFCDAPSCGQFFMRRRRDQRWCGPACGTRTRVARHATRTR